MSEPTTAAGRALYDAMRESAVGLPERLTGAWPYRDAVNAIEAEARRAALDEAIAALDPMYEYEWRDCGGGCHDVTLSTVMDALTRLRYGASPDSPEVR